MYTWAVYIMWLCILQQTKATGVNAKIWIGQTTMDWNGARNICEQKKGTLITIPNTDSLKNLSASLENNSQYWLGGIINQTGWMWAKDGSAITPQPLGCFHLSSNAPLNDSYPNNQAQACINWCNFSLAKKFAILQVKNCFCDNNVTNYEKLDDCKCNINCPGDPKQKCGGTKSYTVHKATSEVRWTTGGPPSMNEEKHCARVLLSGKKELIWYPDDCNYETNFICRYDALTICNGEGAEVPCYIKSSQKMSWPTAAVWCEQTGGYLVEFRGNDERLSVKTLKHEYWAGLTRRNVVWEDGKHVIFDPLVTYNDSVNESLLCLGMDTQYDAEYIVGKPCEERRHPLCLLDIKDMEEAFMVDTVNIYAAVGGTLLVIVLAVFIIVVVNVRRRHAQRQVARGEQSHVYYVLDPDIVKMEMMNKSQGGEEVSMQTTANSEQVDSKNNPKPHSSNNHESEYDILWRQSKIIEKPKQENSTYDHLMFADSGHITIHARNSDNQTPDGPIKEQMNSEHIRTPGVDGIPAIKISDSIDTLYDQPKFTDALNDEDHLYDSCSFRRSLDMMSIDPDTLYSTPSASAGNTLNRKYDICSPHALDERLYESLGSLVDQKAFINKPNVDETNETNLDNCAVNTDVLTEAECSL